MRLLLTCILLVTAAGDAQAMELDTLLPTDIPGYGVPPVITILDRSHPEYTPADIDLGHVEFEPKINADTGYDSQPNGVGPGSFVFSLNPSITALDPILGLGAYASANYTDYPTETEQNLSGYTVAVGEHALLPHNTFNLAIAALESKNTGFSLNTLTITKPIGMKVKDINASDAVLCGTLTLTPEISTTIYQFSGARDQNRTDYRQSLTADISPGGPARFVALLHATESSYADRQFSANTYSALAGIADEATGIWNFRLLAGAATRQAATGTATTTPVLEASISWMPGDLDSVKLDAAREIDDPDEESAAGYTLSQVNISLAHEYLRNVILTASFKFSHAAYFNSSLVESLYNAGLGANWHLNRAIAVNAAYAFNDRQSNFLQAANQHIFTLGVTWSP